MCRGVAGTEGGILDEYVRYAHVFDEKRHDLGYTIDAVQETIETCIERGILREYLTERREEAVAMMTGMLDREEAMAAYRREIEREARREARREALAEGIERTRLDDLRSLMSKLSLSAEEAADILDIPEEDKQRLLSQL